MNIPKISWWVAVAPLFILPFLALYVSSSLFFPFITGKNFLFRMLMEVSFGGYILLALSSRAYRPRFSWTFAAYVGLLVWMAIADALAVNAHKAFWSNYERMDGWVTLVHVVALFIVAGAIFSADKLWRKWWLTFLAAVSLVSVYGLFQAIGGAQIHQGSTRIDASLGNAEYFAAYLLLAIAIALWQAFASNGWLKWSLIALAVVDTFLLFGTGTRGTFVALIVAAGFAGAAWLFSMGKAGRRGGAAFLAAVIIFAGGFYAIRNTAFIQHSPVLSRFATISVEALSPRFDIWKMALEGAKARPIAGWGQEGFNYVFNSYFIPTMYGQEAWFDRAHDIYLDWLIAGGIPALLLLLLLLGSAAWTIFRSRDIATWERIIILSAFVGYAVQGLVVFDNLFTYIPLAMLLAYAHQLGSRPWPMLEGAKEWRGAMLDTIAAPVVLVLALGCLYFVNIPSYAAASELIKGLGSSGPVETHLSYFKQALDEHPFGTQEIREQLLQFVQTIPQDTPVATRASALQFANDQIDQEIAHAPKDARLYALKASFLRGVGQYDLARAAATKAHELSPQKQTIMVEQGLVEWQSGHPQDAQTFFDQAYALAPTAQDLSVYAAIGHIITGDITGGKQIVNQNFGTTTPGNILLAFAYQDAKDWDDLIATLVAQYAEKKDANSGYELATAYAEAGRIAQARAEVRQVMGDHPESSSQGAALLVQLGTK